MKVDFPTIEMFTKDEQSVLRKYLYISQSGYVCKPIQEVLEDSLDDEPMDAEEIKEILDEYKTITRLGFDISVWIEYIWNNPDYYYIRTDAFYEEWDSEGNYYEELYQMRDIADWYEEKNQLTDDWDSDFVKRFQTDNEYIYFECYKQNWLIL